MGEKIDSRGSDVEEVRAVAREIAGCDSHVVNLGLLNPGPVKP